MNPKRKPALRRPAIWDLRVAMHVFLHTRIHKVRSMLSSHLARSAWILTAHNQNVACRHFRIVGAECPRISNLTYSISLPRIQEILIPCKNQASDHGPRRWYIISKGNTCSMVREYLDRKLWPLWILMGRMWKHVICSLWGCLNAQVLKIPVYI